MLVLLCIQYKCVFMCVYVCVRVCGPVGIPVTGLRIKGEAMQGMHVMSCCYCAVHMWDIRETAVTFFRCNLTVILNVLLQTKEKVLWHARK